VPSFDVRVSDADREVIQWAKTEFKPADICGKIALLPFPPDGRFFRCILLTGASLPSQFYLINEQEY
jgi:hypothetical protein